MLSTFRTPSLLTLVLLFLLPTSLLATRSHHAATAAKPKVEAVSHKRHKAAVDSDEAPSAKKSSRSAKAAKGKKSAKAENDAVADERPSKSKKKKSAESDEPSAKTTKSSRTARARRAKDERDDADEPSSKSAKSKSAKTKSARREEADVDDSAACVKKAKAGRRSRAAKRAAAKCEQRVQPEVAEKDAKPTKASRRKGRADDESSDTVATKRGKTRSVETESDAKPVKSARSRRKNHVTEQLVEDSEPKHATRATAAKTVEPSYEEAKRTTSVSPRRREAEVEPSSESAAEPASTAVGEVQCIHKGRSPHCATITIAKPKARGQQAIDAERTRQIQEALIREHYLDGEPSGEFDAATREALTRYQRDNQWQTKILPDSRALIKLGLGPTQRHLLNPDSAAITPARPTNSDASRTDAN